MYDLHIPANVVLEMTYACNFRCVFCSCPWEAGEHGPAYVKGTELAIDQWREILDRLAVMGVRNVSISGGEALLKDGVVDLLEYVRKDTDFNKDGEIVFISNGALLDDATIDAFRRLKIHLSLSLQGLDTYDAQTGTSGIGAGNVLHWLGKAHEAGIGTTANITLTAWNYHEAFDLMANALIAGADTLLLNRFLPGGRGLSRRQELALTPAQLNGMLETAEKVLGMSRRKGHVGTEFPLCAVEGDGRRFKEIVFGHRCAAAKDFFVVDPAGFVRVCNHSPVKVGHALEGDVVEDVAYWRTFTDRAYIPDACVMCRHVSFCDCGCREVASICTGSLRALDPDARIDGMPVDGESPFDPLQGAFPAGAADARRPSSRRPAR
ncbi:MAG: radical SAM protein [Desulfovibrio sp.]|jgi:radical SAM protein with 4Fe4S-binding SPASM domain|nr:radical SAM protein [Desulfovibrio sp.]